MLSASGATLRSVDCYVFVIVGMLALGIYNVKEVQGAGVLLIMG